ncbi:MAG: hypothetical protein IPJ19_05210 [Planctomycetes bacterium]|nr:hypothetical protein [Planctomycetota bacterium]
MLTLVAFLALSLAQAPGQAPAVDWAELMRRFQADADALVKVGQPLELAKLKVEKLDPGESTRVVAKRDADFFGAGWYQMLWLVARASGVTVDPTADAFQINFQRFTTPPQPAWYLPSRKSIVIEESHYSKDALFDRVVLNELALASFDQQEGGLEALRTGMDTEALLGDRAWITGRSRTLARRALGYPTREALGARELRRAEFVLVELAGEAEVARQEALPKEQRTRAKTGMELLHGFASGMAEPTGLEALDPKDAKLAREDTLGELGLRFVLSVCGSDPVRSIEAAIGLCADRLRVWDYGDRDHEFAWRLVFARESDAVELEELLRAHAFGTRTRRGCVLDWSFSTRPDREPALAQGLAALALPPAPSEVLAARVAREQEAQLALQPHVAGSLLVLPEQDLSLELPPGATFAFFQFDPIVYLGPPDAGFRDNLSFRQYLLPEDATAEKVLEGARQSFQSVPSAKLVRSQIADTASGPGVWIEYTQSNSGVQVRQLELQLVQPGRKLAITATLLENHWTLSGKAIETMLASATRLSKSAAPEPVK